LIPNLCNVLSFGYFKGESISGLVGEGKVTENWLHHSFIYIILGQNDSCTIWYENVL